MTEPWLCGRLYAGSGYHDPPKVELQNKKALISPVLFKEPVNHLYLFITAQCPQFEG